MSDTCTIRINGVERAVPAGAALAAAMGSTGEAATRRSVSGELRGPLCGMGVCYECRATVDGVGHVRACTVAVRPGMDVRTDAPGSEACARADSPRESKCDVLVVGGGPAGLAAAAAATESGRSVVLLDHNPGLGGQIWRNDDAGRSREWRDRVRSAQVESGTAFIAPMAGRRILAVGAGGPVVFEPRGMILATGATEFFLPFPGWTLPNVMGVGGLQAMVKSGLEVRGKRIVIAGSGPLLWAVAASLKRRGADVRLIAEQADPSAMVTLAAALLKRPRKLAQAIAFKAALHDVEQRWGWWPVSAEGNGRVEGVMLTNGTTRERLACDYLATGIGLVPSSRLASLLGCRVEGGAVIADDLQRTSVESVFAAGECTGIGGVDKALIEGRIAGLACAGRERDARRLVPGLVRERRFAAALTRTFALRPELRAVVQPDTIVCRCEDVQWGEIAPCESWRDAKLQTRCGMGPCQGRVCGAAVAWLTGWRVEDARPPVFNVPVGVLASMDRTSDDAGRENKERA